MLYRIRVYYGRQQNSETSLRQINNYVSGVVHTCIVVRFDEIPFNLVIVRRSSQRNILEYFNNLHVI